MTPKNTFRFVFGSVTANISMVVGIALLVLALNLGINPADGSAVNPLVRGTWIAIFLFLATIPAMAAMLFAGDGIVGFALMFFLQTAMFWALGRVVVCLLSAMVQQNKNR